MDKGWGTPNPSRLQVASKGTRVGGPPTLHDLRWPPNGRRLGPLPTLHDLAGVPFERLTADFLLPILLIKCVIYFKLLADLGVPPITSAAFRQGSDPLNLSRFGAAPDMDLTASTYVSKPTRRLLQRSTSQRQGPSAQNVSQHKPQILFGQALGPPNRRTLEHISKSTGSPSTDRNINDRALRPGMYMGWACLYTTARLSVLDLWSTP